MNSLRIPDTGMQIVDGTIVILARFPGTKWIVHNGWYTYNSQQAMGWYFQAIPSKTIIPVTDTDLQCLTVVGTDCNCHAPPTLSPAPPVIDASCGCHAGEPGEVFTSKHKYELNRSWITVDTIIQRDALFRDELVANGRIVRVNQTVDGPKYYRWDEVSGAWVDETFGIDPNAYVKSADLQSDVETIIQINDTVRNTIANIAQTGTSATVDKFIQDYEERLLKVEDSVEWKQF